MNLKNSYQKLKTTVFNMENKAEREDIANKFNRLSEDAKHYVIRSDMFPSLYLEAALPQPIIDIELRNYARVLVLDENPTISGEQLERAIKLKVEEALEKTYFENRFTGDIVMANGNGFEIIYHNYEDKHTYKFERFRTGMKKNGCNEYVIQSELLENPTLPPYSKAYIHQLKKHFVEDTCILMQKAEIVHNVFTGEKNIVKETIFCGYYTSVVKYKKEIIKNGKEVSVERKNLKKGENQELSFEVLKNTDEIKL